MGKGGQLQTTTTAVRPTSTNKQQPWVSPYNPHDKSVKLPTKGELKKVIPAHCFERSTVWSLYYTARDVAWVVACAYVTNQVLSTNVPHEDPLNLALWFLGWNIYAFCMGTILFGPWILGHECGHGAFASSQVVNDTVGFVLHQALLVPYFAWQHSHAKHHRRVNHLTDGESHVPSRKEDVGLHDDNNESAHATYLAKLHDQFGEEAFAGIRMTFYLIFGYPIYLLGAGSTGRLAVDGTPLQGRVMDHYRPNSPLFPPKLFWKICLSTVTQIGFLGTLSYLGYIHGPHTVFLWYGAPYLWVNAWLVTYTWLHHTDASVPHYGSSDWTWIKGALATIDRPYGIFDFFHHRIGSTHVLHHLFHELPWYHAYEATDAIREYLEPLGLYNYDPAPFYVAMWRIAKECHYVDGDEGVQYYKSLRDVVKKTKQN